MPTKALFNSFARLYLFFRRELIGASEGSSPWIPMGTQPVLPSTNVRSAASAAGPQHSRLLQETLATCALDPDAQLVIWWLPSVLGATVREWTPENIEVVELIDAARCASPGQPIGGPTRPTSIPCYTHHSHARTSRAPQVILRQRPCKYSRRSEQRRPGRRRNRPFVPHRLHSPSAWASHVPSPCRGVPYDCFESSRRALVGTTHPRGGPQRFVRCRQQWCCGRPA